MNKCLGCGTLLDSDKSLCDRCFRIKHYSEYQKVKKTNEDFKPILEAISNTNDLILLVVDIMSLSNNIKSINKYLNDNVILVVTKRDVLPKRVYEVNIEDYISKLGIKYRELILVSSNKNYNMDELYDMMIKYQTSKTVYVVGFTNAGKSTLINKIISNYSDLDFELTTSLLTSTTIGTIDIKLNDNLTLVDTPGLLDSGNIVDVVDNDMLKKLTFKKEIKPITYQIKVPQTILVEDIVRIDLKPYVDLTLYIPNSLQIKRIYKDNDCLGDLKKHSFDIKKNNDIVILGLGFIKVNKNTKVSLYLPIGVDYFIRESLI